MKVQTCVPAELVPNQSLSFRPKWPIFWKCTNTKRRTTRPFKTAWKKVQFFTKLQIFYLCEWWESMLLIKETKTKNHLHWAKEQVVWKQHHFELQQSRKRVLFCFDHQHLHNLKTDENQHVVDQVNLWSY